MNSPHRDIYETAVVIAAVQDVRNCLADLLQQHLDKLYRAQPLLDACESPIEVVWAIWWLAFGVLAKIAEKPYPYTPIAQYEIECGDECYRLDFAFPDQKVAVELDGHAFHERTVEQVIARDQRDRHLQMAGWCVLHWSGTELLRGAAASIDAVYTCLETVMPPSTVPAPSPSQALAPTPKRGR